MDDLPADLVAVLPESGIHLARQWWASLSDADRRKVAGLWDERLEVQFFTPQADESGCTDEWEHVPAVEGGRFAPSDNAPGLPEWGPVSSSTFYQTPTSFWPMNRPGGRFTSDAAATRSPEGVSRPEKCQSSSNVRWLPHHVLSNGFEVAS